jgi:transposase
MPWSETTSMRERVKLVAAFSDGIFSMTELAQLHGISRKTGYKWVERFEQEGLDGLKERSRAPKSSPHRTPEQVVSGVLEARRRHPSWGPKKLIAWLEDHRSEQTWPAASTAGEILKRHGLVRGRPFRRRVEHPGRTLYPVLQPNDLWTADFKGKFRTGDSQPCGAAETL